MVLWNDLDIETIQYAGSKNGTTKFSLEGNVPLRFQIPRGRVLYNGLSGFKSITIEMPPDFVTWWREKLEPALAGGLTPFNSNMKEYSLRLKVDKSTQVFDARRQIQFPELVEGLFGSAVVTCIAEITGTYFFQDNYGLTCRIHQVVVAEPEFEAEPEEPTESVKGFAFVGV